MERRKWGMTVNFPIEKTVEEYQSKNLNEFLDDLNQIRFHLDKKGVTPIFILNSYGLVVVPIEKLKDLEDQQPKRGKFE